jgi:hypothetical protein
MNVLEQIDQANAAHTLHLKTMILNGVRDLLFGETAEALVVPEWPRTPADVAKFNASVPLPPLAKTIAPSGSLKRKAKTGTRRDPKVLAKLTVDLALYISRNSGQRIEQIAKGMGVSTKDLKLPAKKLIADKAVKTRGARRATVYLPAKGAR